MERLAMNAYKELSTGHGRLSVSAYLSESDNVEFEVRVYEISLRALLTSMIHIDESIKNIARTIVKVMIDIVDRPFRLPTR